MLPQRGNPGARQFRPDTLFFLEEDPDKIKEPYARHEDAKPLRVRDESLP